MFSCGQTCPETVLIESQHCLRWFQSSTDLCNEFLSGFVVGQSDSRSQALIKECNLVSYKVEEFCLCCYLVLVSAPQEASSLQLTAILVFVVVSPGGRRSGSCSSYSSDSAVWLLGLLPCLGIFDFSCSSFGSAHPRGVPWRRPIDGHFDGVLGANSNLFHVSNS